jgi:YD repeat-containing protein
MRWCLSLLLVLVLVGCGSGDSDPTASRVFIRNNGEVVTTYELGKDGEVLQSTTKDRYGADVTRQYTYDAQRELVSVTRESAARGSVTTFVARETDPASRRLAGTTKRAVAADGTSTEMELEYFYAKDGSLEGIAQRDANGNVQAKGGDDSE